MVHEINIKGLVIGITQEWTITADLTDHRKDRLTLIVEDEEDRKHDIVLPIRITKLGGERVLDDPILSELALLPYKIALLNQQVTFHHKSDFSLSETYYGNGRLEINSGPLEKKVYEWNE